jgi:DNA gyrase subunit A
MIEEHETQTVSFTPELDRAYRLYAAKTIEDRALPDVRDGCKPVQRRILYAMHDMGLLSSRPQRKCARIVGEVLGKYHPHGDQSVYGALVRMAQDFSLREPLVDGQGNFGSIDGDGAAAMRYTEARLSPLGERLLQDIDADTVDFFDNFDNSLQEPSVLPSAFPNLLVNGASGIAVGMATNIPPHNLGEISDAIVHVVANWPRRDRIKTEELMQFVPGPDFPTGGLVYRYRSMGGEVRDTIRRAYARGQGRIIVQARMHVEPIAGNKHNIVISELPYNVQKSTVLERIAREVKDGRISGITDLRDESDFDDGMRVVVEVSRTARPEDVMADLLKYSQLQETFGVNSLALVPAGAPGMLRPKMLSLREMLVRFIGFRLEVIERRSRHELDRREARLHIVQGLLIALNAIDEVVAIIKRSKTPETARNNLVSSLDLSEIQASAILDMPLRRLTSLETTKLKEEGRELATRIGYLKALLASEAKRLAVVVDETETIKREHASPRRTVILDSEETVAGTHVVTEGDLRMPDGPQVVLITTAGIERRPASGFRYLRTEGLTSRATTSQLFQLRADPQDEVLFVSNLGRAWRKGLGYVPEKASLRDLGLAKGETIVGAGVIPAGGLPEDHCLVVGTLAGRVKRTLVSDLGFTPGHWSTIVGLPDDDDAVLFAGLAGDAADILFASQGAMVLRTPAAAVNPQASGSARGVAGFGLKKGDRLLAGRVLPEDEQERASAFIVSATGFVKRVPLSEYPSKGRGTGGVRTLNVSAKTGEVVAIAFGVDPDGLDLIFENGRRHSLTTDAVPESNRYNQGEQLVDMRAPEAPVVAVVAL